MEQIILNGEEIDKELTLGEMRNYLLEWYTDGIAEHTTKFDEVYFEDYDRSMTIKDAKTEKDVFYAVFRRSVPINDNSKVYLSGVVDEELRELIGKCIDFDTQKAKKQIENAPQKGE